MSFIEYFDRHHINVACSVAQIFDQDQMDDKSWEITGKLWALSARTFYALYNNISAMQFHVNKSWGSAPVTTTASSGIMFVKIE